MTSRRKISDSKGLTMRENLIMTPIEKHIYYNKFPWRLLTSIVLVCLVTAQIWFIFDYDAGYSRQQQWAFRYLFMGTTDDHTPVIQFNSPSDFQNHLLQVQSTFQNFNQYMFQTIDLNSVDLSILAYDKALGFQESFPVNISQGFITDAFNVSSLVSLKLFMEGIAEMTIIASNMTFINPSTNGGEALCQNWTVQLQYDLEQFTQIDFTMLASSLNCGQKSAMESTAIVLSFIIIITAFILFLLSFQKIYKVGQVFLKLRASYINYVNEGRQKDRDVLDRTAQELNNVAESYEAQNNIKNYLQYNSWEDVPISAKMKFFSPWFIFSIFGNLFQMISSLIMIITFFSPTSAQDFFIANVTLGFSAFFTWTQVLQYLKYWKDVTLMTTTMLHSGPNTGVYFGIVIPIFIGFAILAYSLFWKYDAFTSFGMSLRSLFAMAGGDIVHQTYLDTWDEGIVSSLFFTIYMIVFFTAFMNIFVAVIMDGYDKGKTRQQLDNDDPFPSIESIRLKANKSNSGSVVGLSEQEISELEKDTVYDLKARLEKHLSNPEVDISVRNLLNLLLFYNRQAKMSINELLKVRKEVLKMDHNESTQHFLEGLLANSFNKLTDLLSYYRLALKGSPSKVIKNAA